MTSRLSSITLAGWGGGLSSVDNGERALPNQLTQADNVIINEDGSVSKRMGVLYDTIQGESSAEFMIDICRPFYQDQNGQLWNKNTLMIHDYTNPNKGQYLYVNGKYIHSNGVNKMQTWLLADTTTTDVFGTPPLSRFLHIHNDRCFCANGHNLYETAIDTYPSSTVDNFATGASWQIGDDNTKIIGVGSIGRTLFIFKEASIHIQTGYSKNERQNSIFAKNRGCLSVDSIQTVSVAGIGESIIFLDDKGLLCLLTLSGITEIGAGIQDLLDDIKFDVKAEEVNISDKSHYVSSAILREDVNYYLLGYYSNTDSDWNRCICIHLDKVYNGIPIATLFKTTGETRDGANTTSLSYKVFDDPKRNNYSSTLGVVTTYLFSAGHQRCCDFIKDTILDYIGGTFVYYVTPDRIKTSVIDAGIPSVSKSWNRARVWSSTREYSSLGEDNFRITQYYDRHVVGTNVNDELVKLYVSGMGEKKKCDVIVGLSDASGETSFLFSTFDAIDTGYNVKDRTLHSIDVKFKIHSNRNASSVTA